jgi:hypothetical protein
MRFLLTFCLCLLLVGPIWAADNPPQTQAEVQADEQTVEANEQNGNGPDADQSGVDEDEESAGRFIPTEEISQDLGVSFPVDI